MTKTFATTATLRIRRSPNAPIEEAYVDGVFVKVDDDTLSAWVLLSIRDSGSRPDEQVTVGAFLLARWVEMAQS